MDDTTQILVQIFAPFGGVLIAFLLGVEYDRWKKRKDRKEDKIELIKLIIAEIKECKEGLENPENKIGEIRWNKEDHIFIGNYGLADLPVVESSINSGRFLLLSSKLQSTISTANIRLKHYNWFMEQVINFQRSGLHENPLLEDREAENLLGHLKIHKENLLKEFAQALSDLTTELNIGS